jgi:hypothetical protein
MLTIVLAAFGVVRLGKRWMTRDVVAATSSTESGVAAAPGDADAKDALDKALDAELERLKD